MKKLLKSKKALSPVVAAIILIAVTVAVSIAVAAWMGALTFTFMKTEELKITSVTFPAAGQTKIAFTNTGASTLTISSVTVDDVGKTTSETLPMDVDKGVSGSVTINGWNWTSGTKYTFALLTAGGNKYTYTTTATATS
jgi:flagellin-like protein